jgi:hypothetical protein
MAAPGNSSDIVDRIELCSASTVEGFRVKAVAILWCNSGDLTDRLLQNDPATDARIADPSSFIYWNPLPPPGG